MAKKKKKKKIRYSYRFYARKFAERTVNQLQERGLILDLAIPQFLIRTLANAYTAGYVRNHRSGPSGTR